MEKVNSNSVQAAIQLKKNKQLLQQKLIQGLVLFLGKQGSPGQPASGSPVWAGDWTRWPPEFPSNLNHSMNFRYWRKSFYRYDLRKLRIRMPKCFNFADTHQKTYIQFASFSIYFGRMKDLVLWVYKDSDLTRAFHTNVVSSKKGI